MSRTLWVAFYIRTKASGFMARNVTVPSLLCCVPLLLLKLMYIYY